jgi:antitoxin component of MazEF toxin-antitoxin module
MGRPPALVPYHRIQKVTKKSGSLFIVVPRIYCALLKIGKGDLMSVKVEDDKIIYEKCKDVENDNRLEIRQKMKPNDRYMNSNIKKKDKEKPKVYHNTSDYERFLESLDEHRVSE